MVDESRVRVRLTPDDLISSSMENVGYINDLALAAELGKTLLNQNRMLEQALDQARVEAQERDIEIEILHKQLSDLRELSQRRGALVDEADGYNQELDRLNRQLIKEMTSDKQKIERLKIHVASLEQEVSDLTEQLNQCTCDQSSIHRRSVTTGALDRWIVRSGSTSPLRHTPPLGHSTFSSTQRKHSTINKGLFIDDELQDQPQLSAYQLLQPDALIQTELSSAHEVRLTHAYCSQQMLPSLHGNRSSSLPVLYTEISLSEGAPMLCQKPSNLTSTNQIGLIPDRDTPLKSNAPVFQRNFKSQHSTTTDEPCRLPLSATSCSLSHSTQTSCNADDLKALKDVLDDATFIRHLEAIYSLKLRCQKPNDYQPSYKHLFEEAFQLLRSVRKNHETKT